MPQSKIPSLPPHNLHWSTALPPALHCPALFCSAVGKGRVNTQTHSGHTAPKLRVGLQLLSCPRAADKQGNTSSSQSSQHSSIDTYGHFCCPSAFSLRTFQGLVFKPKVLRREALLLLTTQEKAQSVQAQDLLRSVRWRRLWELIRFLLSAECRTEHFPTDLAYFIVINLCTSNSLSIIYSSPFL